MTNHTKISKAIETIGMALSACHNTITTDRVDAVPDKYSWRIDHAKEIDALEELENLLLNSDTCPLCSWYNTPP